MEKSVTFINISCCSHSLIWRLISVGVSRECIQSSVWNLNISTWMKEITSNLPRAFKYSAAFYFPLTASKYIFHTGLVAEFLFLHAMKLSLCRVWKSNYAMKFVCFSTSTITNFIINVYFNILFVLSIKPSDLLLQSFIVGFSIASL